VTYHPIVFLDFDGVLNTYAWIYSHSERGFDHIAPELVQLVNQLVWRAKAKVVVSSAWRILFNQAELQEGLNEHGFTGEIVGVTDQIGNDRGAQIQRWLTENDHQGPFVILDDEAGGMLHLLPSLVKTDPHKGITQEDVEEALRVLFS
jgi:hypothetical protein